MNIQSRFNLARVYLDRLNDRSKAMAHLKILAATAPPDHPYRQFAEEELRKKDRHTVTPYILFHNGSKEHPWPTKISPQPLTISSSMRGTI